MKHFLWFLYTQFYKEFLLNLRQPKRIIYAGIFFLMVSIFFPMTIVLKSDILKRVGGGVIWFSLLYAILLANINAFQQEYEDGSLEQWILAPYSLSYLVVIKILVQWVLQTLIVIICLPLFIFLYHWNFYQILVLMLSCTLGIPSLLALATLASAFSMSIHWHGTLMALILLPLALPVMIFGSGWLNVTLQGNMHGYVYMELLLAFALISLCFLPPAIGIILTMQLQE